MARLTLPRCLRIGLFTRGGCAGRAEAAQRQAETRRSAERSGGPRGSDGHHQRIGRHLLCRASRVPEETRGRRRRHERYSGYPEAVVSQQEAVKG